jgi:molybdopterin/thiamine biosynthesis adenylyltransferase
MFDYNKAFSRNIGWVTEQEQEILKNKRVAMAGAGGVGSEHTVTLARLGIGKFNISDFDEYEVHNFNRQAGAFVSTIGQRKVKVMAEITKDINPEADIRSFPEGINESNVDEFLEDVDVYVDSLDFFALSARKLVYRKCYEKQIPLVTAAPIGMGVALLCFMPGSMSYEEYFRFEDCENEQEQLVKFLVGLSPSLMQKNYLVDPSTSDFINQKAPSLPMGVKLCGGAAASYVLKILLNRGNLIVAPRGLHFDAYENKLKKTWRPWGNRNPLQSLIFAIAKKIVLTPKTAQAVSTTLKPVEHLFEYAKWAPSGDNEQPQRIEVLDDHSCIIHGHDTHEHVVYDKQGNASKLALGCFLENFNIAAKATGYEMSCELTKNKNGLTEDMVNYDSNPTFKICITKLADQCAAHEPLFPYIKTRCVQRKRMGTRALSILEKQQLEQVLPSGYSIVWIESFSDRWQVAKFMYGNATTRLSMKEGYDVHSKIMEYTAFSKDTSAEQNCNSTFSKNKLPTKSMGIDPITIALMKWSLKSWSRFKFVDKYFAGTVAPKLLLDFSSALRSCAHFVIIADNKPKNLTDYLDAGRAVQRFWLQATALKLGFQPEQTPVIFSEYLRNKVDFTTNQPTIDNAIKMDKEFKRLIGEDNVNRAVFMGRMGRSTTPTSRSVRLSLDELRYVKTE